MATSSPWGKVDYVKNYQRGVRFVSTPSHGGFMISKGFAQKNLSIAAQKRAEEYNGYLCFEEDCLACIVLLELPNTRSEKTLPEQLIESLSYYNADYLIAVGITPEPKAYARYLESQEDSRLRAEKSPNLIVSALGLNDEVVKVYTADGTSHFVTTESYQKRTGLNLLSNCVKVDNFVQTTYLNY